MTLKTKLEMQCLTNQLFLWNRVKNLISFTYFLNPLNKIIYIYTYIIIIMNFQNCNKIVILLIVLSIITMILHIDWMTFPISHFIEIILMLLVAIYLILCIKHHENSGIILSIICLVLLCVLLYENGPYMILHIEPFNIHLTFPL